MKPMRIVWLSILGAGVLGAAVPAAFDKDVQPLLRQSCIGCHNEKLSSGNLNLTPFLEAASIGSQRPGWERIVAKLRAGEMPPKGIPKPAPEQMTALLKYVDSEFERADSKLKPEPGRVTAHRLNRNEYANTVRDLLGVEFRAREEFPADDSGYGFDNIGDVLTVSPTLMQKYLSAAEQIASRAVGGDPLPKPGVILRRDRIRRLSAGSVQLRDIIEYDADYVVRANLVGHRGNDDKPVNLVISVDGKPAKTVSVPVQISAVNRQGGATQRSSQEVKVFLTSGEHTFRAEFVDDEAVKAIPENARLNANRNIFPDAIEIGGPFPSPEPHPSQKRILTCDPASGSSCVNSILATLSRRAYRRPTTKAEVAQLVQIFDKAAKNGYTPAQSLQFAIAAMLVSPQFLFRIERDPKPGASTQISDLDLASRLSYFLWSSMPDDELLRLAEANKLHLSQTLDAQVGRMIADPKSSAFAENFAGQWLETRSLDAMKPDPKLFPDWGPELKDAMRTETRMFFEAVMREGRPIGDFVDGNYTFLNDLLAKHYGIAGVEGHEFRRVELSADSISAQRSGVFTHASVLTVSSYPTRTSVVLRGKYLLENVLNAAPPPPPADIPALNEAEVGVARSGRQQMEQHRADAVCASCHSRMDVLGSALENYDAIGRWRTQDGKFPVDASGAFPNGKSFTGPAGMKTILKDDLPEFTRCLAEKMLTYSLGRGVESYDRRTVQELVRQTTAQNYKLQALILGIVHSAPFQQRSSDLKQTAANTEGGTRK
jgi:mono/diheme cytochrome c family protein